MPHLDFLVSFVPSPPIVAEPGTVVLALATDDDVPVLATVPATHRLLPYVLGRRGTRVRDVAPDVTLPEATTTPPKPLPAPRRRIRLLPNHPAYQEAA